MFEEMKKKEREREREREKEAVWKCGKSALFVRGVLCTAHFEFSANG